MVIAVGFLALSATLQLVFIGAAAFVILVSFLALYVVRTLKKLKDEVARKENTISELNGLISGSQSPAGQPEKFRSGDFETEKFYRKLVQAADDGISFYDRDWNLRYANEAFFSLIGLTREDYNSIEKKNLIHPDDRDYEAKRIKALLQSGYHDTELKLWHKDGYYVILSSRSVTVRDDSGEVLGALNISRDITRLKEVNEELVKANMEVEASNKLKSNFLANVSHEIRTPLNSVVGFSNLLQAEELTDSDKNQYIEQITYNSEKLLQIIGDIIDISRLQSSQIEIVYEEASVKTIIDEVSQETWKNINRNSSHLQFNVTNDIKEDADLIFTDRTWLRRVLLHLLDNAVKFTLKGRIDLMCSRDGDSLIFRIRDTGIGINTEFIDHIFRGFSQEIAGHHRPFEGLGIGLTLVKEVAERLGGKVEVISEKGSGSEFSLNIPYRPAGSIKSNNTSAEAQQDPAIPAWGTTKCLVVDDNRDVLIYLEKLLHDTGIKVFVARSGFEALDSVKAIPDIDIVLLDMQMPGMNGIETARELRKLKKEIAIIAQTAFIFENDRDIILEAGCDACLIKPIRKDQLLAAMSEFIPSS